MVENFESQFGRSVESAAEKTVEKKEAREGAVDPELQAAAALERADYLVKEVKNSKQQMQNIILHMQQVKQAIKQIRQQLQLATTDPDNSIVQDEAQMEKLKKQIAEYQEEIIKMRDDLITAQIQTLQKTNPSATPETVKQEAEQMVDSLILQTQE